MTALWLVLAAAVLVVPRRPAQRWPAQRWPAPRRSAPHPSGRRATGSRDDLPTTGRQLASSPQTGRLLPIISAALAALACLALFGLRIGSPAAALVAPAAALAVRAAGRRAAPLRIDRSVALTLDLAAAGLHSGRPVGDALAAAAPAADPEIAQALLGVSGLLRLGADPTQAWGAVATGALAPVAATAIRSAESGIRLAAAFERLAAEIRADVAAAAAVRAHRAGVTAMAPLAACFLPSFVCLGIVPVVVGIARSALGVLV